MKSEMFAALGVSALVCTLLWIIHMDIQQLIALVLN